MRSEGTPTSSRQMASASSSLTCTVTHSLDASRPSTPVTNSQAKAQASDLK